MSDLIIKSLVFRTNERHYFLMSGSISLLLFKQVPLVVCIQFLLQSFVQAQAPEGRRGYVALEKQLQIQGFEGAEIRVLDELSLNPLDSSFANEFSTNEATHGLKLLVVYFSSSRWTELELKRRTQKLLRHLLNCKIKINELVFLKLDSYKGESLLGERGCHYLKCDSKTFEMTNRLVQKFPDFLMNIYVEEFPSVAEKVISLSPHQKKVYFRSRNTARAFAILRRYKHQKIRERYLQGTMWYSHRALDFKHYPQAYSTEAHEMGHVLMNLGGHPSRTIMSIDFTYMNKAMAPEDITFAPYQCQVMIDKRVPLLTPIQ